MKANNSINTPGAKAIAIDLVKTDLVEHIKFILNLVLVIKILRDVCSKWNTTRFLVDWEDSSIAPLKTTSNLNSKNKYLKIWRSTSVPRNLRGHYLFSRTVYNNPIFSARRQHLPTPSTPTTPCSQYHGSTVRLRQAYKVTGYLNQHVGQSPTLHTAAHTFGNDAHPHYPTHSSRSSLRRLSALTERLSRIGRLRQSLWCG